MIIISRVGVSKCQIIKNRNVWIVFSKLKDIYFIYMSVWIGKSKICLKTYFLRKESCKKMETLFFFFQLNPLCSSISIELWGYFEYLWEDYRQCRLQNYDIPRTLDPWFSVYLYWYVGVQMNFYMSTLWKYLTICVYFLIYIIYYY